MEFVGSNFFAVVSSRQSVLCPGALVHVATNCFTVHLVHEIEIPVEVDDFGERGKGLSEGEWGRSGSWSGAKLDGMKRAWVHGAVEQCEEHLRVRDVTQSAIHDDEQEAIHFIHIKWLIVDDPFAPVELSVHPFLGSVQSIAKKSNNTVEEASHTIHSSIADHRLGGLLGHDLPLGWLSVDHGAWWGTLDGTPLRLSVLPATDLRLGLGNWNSDVRLHIRLGLSRRLIVTGNGLWVKLALVAIWFRNWGRLLFHCGSRASLEDFS